MSHLQIPEPCIIELIWFPETKRNWGKHNHVFGRPSKACKASFELILVWSQSRQSCRVDAVWVLDKMALSPGDKRNIRDLLDAELESKFPDVLIRSWSSTLIE